MNPLRTLATRLLTQLSRGPLAKLARHTLALATGWLVTQPSLAGQPAADQNSLWSVLTLLIVWLLITGWSFISKRQPGADAVDAIRAVASAAAAHIAPILVGIAVAHGYTGAEDSLVDLAEWGVLWVGNLILSFASRPDSQDPPAGDAALAAAGLGVKSALALLLLPLAALSGCAQVRQAASLVAEDYTLRTCIEIPVGKLLHGHQDAQPTLVEIQK